MAKSKAKKTVKKEVKKEVSKKRPDRVTHDNQKQFGQKVTRQFGQELKPRFNAPVR